LIVDKITNICYHGYIDKDKGIKMSRTRSVRINTKISIEETLKMIAQANDSGFAVPGAAVYGCLTRKQVAQLCDNGLIEERDSVYMRSMGAGNNFYITEKGRQFIK
jgi:predicted transcriptional regulator